MNTITLTKTDSSISSAKANRLFWLGRYAERVYTALHMLRKHYDRMIDEDENAYVHFCTLIGIENRYISAEDFMQRYLFDESNPDSVINMLERAHDNAILLREEIMSETLSYIQLSICYMKKCQSLGQGLNDLQLVTDYMLSFWGSIDERILTSQIRNMLKFGKYIECADLHIRFGYSFVRVNQIIGRMMETIEKECYVCDELTLLLLQQQVTSDKYREPRTLQLLNRLFCA